MAASNRWNLSTDYYDILPADSEMDAPDGYYCEYCDGVIEENDYFVPESEWCDCDNE